MPNWVTNIITITGRDDELLQVFEFGFDFQKICPCPYIKDGRSTDERWYKWCLAHWGTKWPADDVELIQDKTEGTNSLRIRCSTAWTPPTGILALLSEIHSSLTITDKFIDEFGDSYGFLQCRKGTVEYKRLEPHLYKPKAILALGNSLPWFSPEDYLKFMGEMGCNLEKVDNDSTYSDGPVKLIEHTFTYDEFIEEMSKEPEESKEN